MYQTYQNTLAIPAELLYEDLNLLTYSNYKYYCQTDKINKIRRGGNGRQALIEFASLPELFKQAVKNAFGDPYRQNDLERLIDRLENNVEASRFFESYQDEEGRGLLAERIAQYYAESQILDLYEKLIYDIKVKQRNGMRIKIGPAKKEICAVINQLKTVNHPNSNTPKFPHNLPSNYRALDNKLKRYKEDGFESLIHSAIGNSNSTKIKGEVAEWILAFYMLPNKPVVPVLHTQYMKVRTAKGWPVLSESAISKWLMLTPQKKIWYLGRHGLSAWRNEFGHKIKRDRSDWFPNAYWAIDGSKLDWVHFKDNDGGMGADIKIDVLFDVFSERIIGYSYSESETHGDHFKSLKMGVTQTMRKPFLLTYDGQSGHTSSIMQDLYDKIVATNGGEHYKHAARQHGSPVEQLFSRFQQQVLNTKWFSDKQSVKSKKLDSHPNVDFIKSNKHMLSTFEKLERAFEQCVVEWNTAEHPNFKGQNRLEVYDNTPEELSEPISEFGLIDMFWVTTKNARNYDTDGIKPIISKTQYHYEVYDADGNYDHDFRNKYTHQKFFIQYDPSQMDNYVRLLLKLPDGKMQHIADAQPKRLTKQIPALMSEHDKASMHKDRKAKEDELAQTQAKVKALQERTGLTPEKLIEDQELNIKLGGSLPKERRSEVESLSFLDRM